MSAHVLEKVPGHTSVNQLHSGSMYYKAAGSMHDTASTMCGASWLASGETNWYAYVLDVGTLPSLRYPHKGCNQPTLNPYMCQCTDKGLATKRYRKECNTALGDSDCTLDPGYLTAQCNIVGCAVIALALFASTCLAGGAYHARPALITLLCGASFPSTRWFNDQWFTRGWGGDCHAMVATDRIVIHARRSDTLVDMHIAPLPCTALHCPA